MVFVLHINVRSLTLNLEKIEEFIDTLDTKPDVICITETKISNKTDISLLELDGYSFVHNDSDISFGGTGIYVSNDLTFSKRNDLDINISGECETSFIELNFSESDRSSIILCSLYRHPHNNLEEFYATLHETFSKFDRNTTLNILDLY